MNYEDILVAKTAWYYHIENMTQQKISGQLGISRVRVIKSSEKARQDSVIQFRIHQDGVQWMKLERQLSEIWNLKDIFIVPTPPDTTDVNKTIAQAASMHVSDRITEYPFINMGYGDTLNHVPNRLAILSEFPVSVISPTGGVSYYLPSAQSHIFNVKLYLLPAPLLVSSPEMVKVIMQEPSVTEIMRMVCLAPIILIGTGGMTDNTTILTNGIVSKNDFFYLSMRGAVGDVLSHFIGKNDSPARMGVENRLISTPLDTLRQLGSAVGVTAGHDKVEAIRAALHGKHLDILIIDKEAAQALIDGETEK